MVCQEEAVLQNSTEEELLRLDIKDWARLVLLQGTFPHGTTILQEGSGHHLQGIGRHFLHRDSPLDV